MTSTDLTLDDVPIARRMRPLVILVACANIAVTALLITTASLATSPLADAAYQQASR